MTIRQSSSHLEFDCAHGDINVSLTQTDGSLAANGTYVREHGGPVRADEPADTHPAVYSGTVSGNNMRLSVRLTDSGDVLGPFSLVRGVAGRVAKCL